MYSPNLASGVFQPGVLSIVSARHDVALVKACTDIMQPYHSAMMFYQDELLSGVVLVRK